MMLDYALQYHRIPAYTVEHGPVSRPERGAASIAGALPTAQLLELMGFGQCKEVFLCQQLRNSAL